LLLLLLLLLPLLLLCTPPTQSPTRKAATQSTRCHSFAHHQIPAPSRQWSPPRRVPWKRVATTRRPKVVSRQRLQSSSSVPRVHCVYDFHRVLCSPSRSPWTRRCAWCWIALRPNTVWIALERTSLPRSLAGRCPITRPPSNSWVYVMKWCTLRADDGVAKMVT
jgi:hypothetical protein